MSFLDSMSPQMAADAARPVYEENRVLLEQIEAVYDWLVEDLAFPFDMTTETQPRWLDVDRLARKWAERDGETADNYRWAILAETGWGDQA